MQISENETEPDVTDVKLLPGGFIVIADKSNYCIKLFDTQVIMADLKYLDNREHAIFIMILIKKSLS